MNFNRNFKGKYIRIIGRPLPIEPSKIGVDINVFKWFPLQTYNEITNHFVQCLANHLLNQNSWIKSYNLPPENKLIEESKNNNYDNKNNDDKKDNNDNHCSISAVLTTIQKKVYHIIDSSQFVQGCDITEINNKLTQYSDKEIKKTLSYLLDNAYIYTTINDNKFKTS